jgi:uncharacterized protein YkwD
MTRYAAILLAFCIGCDKPASKPIPPVINSNLTLLDAHNNERAKIKVGPLVTSARLMNAAQAHADWMKANGKLDHKGEGGLSFGDRMRNAGYVFTAGGENIAGGQRNVQEVMDAWMSSIGHRLNIQRASYKEMGWGRSGNYWCVLFGTPK